MCLRFAMRQLIRRLQGAKRPPYTSPRYVQLRSPLIVEKENGKRVGFAGDVPEGYLPVYVGKESRRFIIKARLLNHPILAELLQRSAEEYGYEHKGGLKIPCEVSLFQHVIFLLSNEDPVARNLRLRDLAELHESVSRYINLPEEITSP